MNPEYREFLEKLYEMTNGDQSQSIPKEDVGKELAQEPDETKKILNWLVEEGLVKHGPIGKIHLTHQGIKEKEEKKTDGR